MLLILLQEVGSVIGEAVCDMNREERLQLAFVVGYLAECSLTIKLQFPGCCVAELFDLL